ncbi:MAG: SDR family NAD(P)-dependent oxidoreductase [Acidimicrobiia bacterium]|nr:SDR family NAD(P)-dependent oxidoreductase [Acidimicrobiia bacterium]
MPTTCRALAFDADDTAVHDQVLDRAFEDEVDVALVAFGVLGDQVTFEEDPDEAVAAVGTNYVGAGLDRAPTGTPLSRAGPRHHRLPVVGGGKRVRKSNFVYGSSKAGLDGFAQGLGDALAGTGVDVLVVRPGFVRSKMTEGLDDVPFATDPRRRRRLHRAGPRAGEPHGVEPSRPPGRDGGAPAPAPGRLPPPPALSAPLAPRGPLARWTREWAVASR